MSLQKIRIGHGYDVHKFSEAVMPTKPLILASVEIPEKKSLVAHSDGDLILHALCDAMLGAIGAGDIGRYFPDSEDKFKNIESKFLLERVMAMVSSKGFRLVNLDVTVVAQVPKLSPYMSLMTEKLAELVGLAVDCVNIKATTTESMGFIGQEEGMACYAVVLISSDA
jgi:2-C-methyl-D-erythritol 2,4-cyclodiphosphate synthase